MNKELNIKKPIKPATPFQISMLKKQGFLSYNSDGEVDSYNDILLKLLQVPSKEIARLHLFKPEIKEPLISAIREKIDSTNKFPIKFTFDDKKIKIYQEYYKNNKYYQILFEPEKIEFTVEQEILALLAYPAILINKQNNNIYQNKMFGSVFGTEPKTIQEFCEWIDGVAANPDKSKEVKSQLLTYTLHKEENFEIPAKIKGTDYALYLKLSPYKNTGILINIIQTRISSGKNSQVPADTITQALQSKHQSDQLLDHILHTSPDWVYIKDNKFRYTFVNESFAKALEKDISVIIGKTDLELGFWKEEITGSVRMRKQSVRETDTIVLNGKKVSIENDIITLPNGTTKYFITRKFPQTDKQGNITGIIGFSSDITTLREIEKNLKISNKEYILLNNELQDKNSEISQFINKLEKSEKQYRTLVENIPDVIFRYDLEGKHTFASQSAENLFHIKPEVFLDKTHNELNLDKEIIAFFQEQLFEVTNSRSTVESEVMHHANKEPIFINWRFIPEFSKDNILISIFSIGRDITEQMNAQLALSESENRYRKLINNSPLALLVISDDKIVFSNPQARLLFFDSKNKQFENIELWHFVHADYKKQLKEWFKKAHVSEGRTMEEVVLLKQSKQPFYAETILTPIDFKGKQSHQLLITDITSRKLAEEKAEKSEIRLQSIVRTSPIGIASIIANRFIYVNEHFSRLTGYEKEEIIGSTGLKLFSSEKQYQETINKIPELFTSFTEQLETTIITKEGKKLSVSLNASPLETDFPEGGYTLTIADITARKNAESKLLKQKHELEENNELSAKLNEELFVRNKQIKEINSRLKESENRIRQIIDAVPHMIYSKSINGQFIFANRAVSKAYGIPLSDITKLSQSSVHPDADEAIEYTKTDQEVINYQHPVIIPEERFTDINGITHVLQTTKIPIKINNENETAVLCVSVDITEQRMAQKKLIESETKFRTYIESSSIGVFLTDEIGRFNFVNSAFANLLGYHKKEIQEKKLFDIIPESNKTRAIRGVIELRKQKKISNFEISFLNRSKEDIDTVLDSIELSKKQYLHFCKDNTERKVFENEILKAKEKAEQSDRLKSAFLANMSHEIRTPMNGILGFSNLLLNPEINDDKRKKFVDIIKMNGDQLLSIINDIIDTSKIEANQIELVPKMFSLNDLMTDLYHFFSGYADFNPPKDLTVQLNTGLSDLKSWVEFDDVRLKQILMNLLKNAYKFTDKGEIQFGYQLVGQNLRFFVKDTGIGIPAEKQMYIFERFRQGNEGNSRLYGGTGLGLTISKNLVELMGGEIGVNSKEGEGAEFYFTLPYNPMHHKFKNSNNTQTGAYNWEGKTILIAEDEQTNFLFLETILLETNVNILWAKNGKQAIEVFQKNSVDIILMDIKMPILDGFGAFETIRELNNSVPVIAQTAFAMAGDRKKCLEAGFTEYLSKPIKEEELLQLLHVFLKHKV